MTTVIHLWLPPDDQHELAASLGLCESDPQTLRDLIEQAQDQAAKQWPGSRVIVHRWPVWRVVEAIGRVGATNTPDGRAAAYATLGDNG